MSLIAHRVFMFIGIILVTVFYAYATVGQGTASWLDCLILVVFGVFTAVDYGALVSELRRARANRVRH